MAMSLAASLASMSGTVRAAEPATPTAIAIPVGRHVGDLEGMVERRSIRVLTVYSETTFFFDNGTPRGVAFEALTMFGKELNRKLRLPGAPVEILFIPVNRGDLLTALAEGRGDIAAAYLTVPQVPAKGVAYTAPLLTGVRQIVVTGPKSPRIAKLDDLAGQTTFVRRSSSYWTSLTALNETFRARGKPPIVLQAAPETLEDEDLLEMLNAGLLRIVVVDSQLATFWKQMLPRIVPHPGVAVRTGENIAWAIRTDSPQLKSELDAFIGKFGVDTTFGAVLFRRYFKSDRLVRGATDPAELRKFQQLVTLFRQYGDQYSLDWMLMAAQGYQESRLDQNVRSAVGAIGVMQLMPATGESLGVGDIHDVEPNIHAGVKYVRQIIDENYASEPMEGLDKVLFAFAAYNAGPAAVAALRRAAAASGLNPNVWFDQVERVAAERRYGQTVDYVRNIYKYYIAYKLAEEERAAQARAARAADGRRLQ